MIENVPVQVKRAHLASSLILQLGGCKVPVCSICVISRPKTLEALGGGLGRPGPQSLLGSLGKPLLLGFYTDVIKMLNQSAILQEHLSLPVFLGRPK